MCRCTALLALLIFAPVGLAQGAPTDAPTGAEPAETSVFDAFAARFQTDEFRITSLIQVVPRVAFERTEGDQARFEIPRARLGIRGRLDNGIGYGLQTELVREVALLDAIVTYGPDARQASLGLQQTPFSAENLTSDATTDFVERARIVRQVSPGRSIGAQFLMTPGGGPVRLRAGVFNATHTTAVDGTALSVRERGGALLTGRAQTALDVLDGFVVLGANAAYNTDDTSDLVDSPAKLDLGIDARARLGRVLVAGELLRSRTDAPFTPTAPTGLDGGYVTLGAYITPADRVLARLDVIAVEDGEDSTQMVLGYDRQLSRSALVQANLIVPIADAENSFDQPIQLLFNFQFAF